MGTTLSNLYEYVDSHQIEVIRLSTNKIACMSLINEFGDSAIGINPFMLYSERDELVKIAHELGHFETGAFYNIFSTLDIRKKHENRANQWAIKKLIPKDELLNAYQNGICDNTELAEYFNVTEDFLQLVLKYYNENEL